MTSFASACILWARLLCGISASASPSCGRFTPVHYDRSRSEKSVLASSATYDTISAALVDKHPGRYGRNLRGFNILI
jgi:hypothetical protein